MKVSEIFSAIQGEGQYSGTPSLFLRLFGCNFRCPGFGVDKSEWCRNDRGNVVNQEIQTIDAKSITKLEDFPILRTGCDTAYGVYPQFKHLTKNMSVDDIVDYCVENHIIFSPNNHLVITGGEPLLLGNQRHIEELIRKLHECRNLTHVTLETNGTQHVVLNTPKDVKVSASVSVKLSHSGHSIDDRVNLVALRSLYKAADEVWFKFVVGSESDVEEVKSIINQVHFRVFDRPVVYLMPLGGHPEEFAKHEALVADLAAKYGYRYSDRMHVRLFGNGVGK